MGGAMNQETERRENAGSGEVKNNRNCTKIIRLKDHKERLESAKRDANRQQVLQKAIRDCHEYDWW